MGYCIEVECNLKISVKNKTKLKKIFKDLDQKSPKGYNWVTQGFSNLKTVEDIFNEWRYEIEDNGEFYVLNYFVGEKLGNDEILWTALAPIVESDSVLYFTGEDGAHWKYTFKNNKFKEYFGSVEYEDEKETNLSLKKSKKTPYEVLGIKENSSKLEIEKSYKEKMKYYHPDKFGSLDDDFIKLATEKSQELSQAKENALKNLK